VTALYDGVIGQDAAVACLRAAVRAPVHAYLFVGPPGVGKQLAARSFAAALLCPEGGCGACDECSRALHATHPDVVLFERSGARMSVDDAREIQRLATRSPVEGHRKVIVIPEFHLAAPIAAALLKTIEEPPESTVFVALAESVPADFVTITSRCVRVDFRPVPEQVLVDALMAEGVDPEVAAAVAVAAEGRVDRARLLASDPGFGTRRALWQAVPDRLDGRGATVAALADELLASLETIVEPLAARQAEELAELDARAKAYGERGLGRKELVDRHKREQRRARTDELRFGLSAMAGAYRDRLLAGGRATGALAALEAVTAANDGLIRNPNETLLLQALLLRLDQAAVANLRTAPG
jgi:DNA polymerase-3 subunit delta'